MNIKITENEYKNGKINWRLLDQYSTEELKQLKYELNEIFDKRRNINE